MINNEDLLAEYEKKNSRLVVSAVLLNWFFAILLFFNVIQSLVSWITYIPFFDYYITYIILLFLVDCIFISLYIINLHKMNYIIFDNWNQLVLNEKVKIDTLKKNKDIVNKALWFVERAIDFVFRKNSEYEKQYKEFLLFKKNIEDKIEKEASNFVFTVFKICGIFFLIFIWLYIIVPSGKISTDKFISSYENKYKKVENDINNKKENEVIKTTTLLLLEGKKEKYIQEFWTGSDVVKQINDDITELQK